MRFCLLLLFRVGPSSKTSAWVYWFWFVDLHRTALATILRGDVRQGWLSLWALKCSSWTAVNAGTSGHRVLPLEILNMPVFGMAIAWAVGTLHE